MILDTQEAAANKMVAEPVGVVDFVLRRPQPVLSRSKQDLCHQRGKQSLAKLVSCFNDSSDMEERRHLHFLKIHI